MAELVGAVTKITSGFLEINSISIDNWGFKFFYKWTTTLLVFCSVLVTARFIIIIIVIWRKMCSRKSLQCQFYKNDFLLNCNCTNNCAGEHLGKKPNLLHKRMPHICR